jgi:hypothetical protein
MARKVNLGVVRCDREHVPVQLITASGAVRRRRRQSFYRRSKCHVLGRCHWYRVRWGRRPADRRRARTTPSGRARATPSNSTKAGAKRIYHRTQDHVKAVPAGKAGNEIRIGVIYTARELVLDVAESPEQVTKAIEDALGGTTSMLWLTDKKGKQVGVPTDKIAFVEIASDAGDRQVGFGVR